MAYTQLVTPDAKLPKPSNPRFEDHPSFKPAFTPKEMLAAGVFGLNYFGNPRTREADFQGLGEAEELARSNAIGRNMWTKNFFGVKAGMDYTFWKTQGLIFPEDPLGWFHWYCRFHAGRRHHRDLHQISRFKNFVRWVVTGRNQVMNTGAASPVVCQSLLHWSWNPAEVFNLEDKTDYSHIPPARAF